MEGWGEAAMLSLFPRSWWDHTVARLKLAAAPTGFSTCLCSFLPPTISRVSLLPAPCYALAALALTAAPSLNLTVKVSVWGSGHVWLGGDSPAVARRAWPSCFSPGLFSWQQRLTEELQTMENGYHDNPTLEVMETSSEMQEKKVNLNGELGDSWIVPLDTLMKEDLEEEEDTHL